MQAPKTDTPATQTRIELDDLLCPLRNIDEVETQTILSKEANRRINLAFSLGRQELESTLAAERASRLQAEEALLGMLNLWTSGRMSGPESDAAQAYFAKPSVSPEQEKP